MRRAETSDQPDPTPPADRERTRHAVGAWAVLVVAAGGLLGTLGRYEVGLAWPSAPGSFPTSTLVINTSGALVLGVLLSIIFERVGPTHYLRPFLSVGLLGGWTTYSTLAVDAVVLTKGGHMTTALAYLAATFVAGLAAVALGLRVGRLGAPVVAFPIDPDLPEASEESA